MKRLTCICAGILALVACTGTGVALGAGLTLDAWRWADAAVFSQEVLDTLAGKFAAEHEGVRVTMTQIAGNQDTLAERVQVAVAGGSPPDLVFMNRTQVLPLAKQGVLMAIPGQAIQGLQVLFVPWAWNALSYQGRQWGLPFTTDVFLVREESQSFYHENHGHLPTLIRSIQKAATKAEPLERTFLDQLPFAHARTPLWRDVTKALAHGDLVSGVVSPEEFVARAQAQLELAFSQVFGD